MIDLTNINEHDFEGFVRTQDIVSLHRLRFYATSIHDRESRIQKLWIIASELARRDRRY